LLHLFMFFLLFFLLITPVLAQDSPNLYTQYRTDYFFQRDQYQQNYQDYLNKKNVFAQYGTVTAEKDKITATKNLFLSRNSMLKSYLMTLRVSLPNNNDLQQKLKELEDWLDSQISVINSLSSSSDIKNWATTFQNKYPSIQNIFYTSLIQNQINLRQEILSDLRKLAQNSNTEWNSDFTQKSDQINNTLQQAWELTQKNQRQDRFDDFYPEAKNYLVQSSTSLHLLVSDLKSTIVKNNN